MRVLRPLILGKAVALFPGGADADRVEAHAQVAVDLRVDFHAGDDQKPGFGGVIGIIIEIVVGEGQKIVAMPGMEALHLFRRAASIGAGGVAMEAALEHGMFFCKSALTNHNVSLLFYASSLYAFAARIKSVSGKSALTTR